MTQLKNEWLKFIRLKYGWIYIVLFVFICAYSAFNNAGIITSKQNAEAERLLAYYYEKWGGWYNPEISDEMSDYMIYVKSPKYNIENDPYIDDDIKKQMFTSAAAFPMFKRFYASYVLAEQNENVDEVVDIRGYELCMVEYKDIDLFLVIIALTICAVIFSTDKGKGQEDIVKTTRFGKNRVIIGKQLLLLLIIIFFEMVKVAMMILSVGKEYSINDFGIALQNVGYMHNVNAEITIGTALLICAVFEILGTYAACMICGFVITKWNSASAGFITALAFIYVPFFLLEKDKLYRTLPVPSGYMAPYNFLLDIQKFRTQYIIFVALLFVLIVTVYAAYSMTKRSKYGKIFKKI